MKGTIGSILLLALSPLATAQSSDGPTMAGLWDATLEINNVSTPFRLELTGTNDRLTGTLFNGEERYPSTSGSFQDGKLLLEWDYYASRIEATLTGGRLTGQYAGTRRMTGPFGFAAVRAAPAHEVSASDVPDIGGVWWMPTDSSKGEKSWRFVVDQDGVRLSAAILRIDGDTGAIEGSWQPEARKFVISKFDGARAYLMEVSVAEDGSLRILENGDTERVAYTPAVARVRGVPEPIDANQHTRVKDPNEPFRFRFPDHATGEMVANTDERFRDKVVIFEISGSWCPNCHDEAPFLGDLYREYRDQGLEIVSVSFEEPEQLKDPSRLRAFVRQHRLEYPVLLGGDTEIAQEALPQLVNWNTWPATIFLDRSGKVRRVHAGFPSSGSGDLYEAAKEEFRAQVGRLLAE